MAETGGTPRGAAGNGRRGRWLVAVAGLAVGALIAGCQSSASAGSAAQTAGPATSSTTSAVGASGGTTTPATVPADPGAPAGSSLPGDGAATATITPTTTVTPPVARVSASPAFGSDGLTPIQPIMIKVAEGTITALTLTSSSGATVKGSLSADGTSWSAQEALGYGKTYTASGTATGTDGKTVPIKGTFGTLAPTEEITTNVSPGDGAVVGVGVPVIVRFGLKPADKAEIEKHVKITTTPAVKGAWAWITHDGDSYPSLDFRPKEFWPANTKVHVESDIYGVHFSGNYYGGDDVTSDFTIGRNQVVIADASKHNIVVQRDGKTVATYPASFGMGDRADSRYGLNSNFVTRSGTYIVMNKQPKVLMSNPKPGGGWYYKDIPEYWAVRISDNGEFIHENPDTVGEQGEVNVTHGCINLSPDSAKAYYGSAIYGDPVIVSNTSVKLSPSDGDIYDWAIPWSEWVTLSERGEFSTEA